RLYKVFRNHPSNDEIRTNAITPVPLALALQKDIPEIEKVARTTTFSWDFLINYQSKSLKLPVLTADSSFLDMFDFEYKYGNRGSSLPDFPSIILTESGSKAIFGDVNPIGQTIT